MNCVELQQSLAEVEDVSSWQQKAHLRACPACSALVRELNLDRRGGRRNCRRRTNPVRRVWNSIEFALRQEGLIRPAAGAGAFLQRALGSGAMAGAGGGDVIAGSGNLRAA